MWEDWLILNLSDLQIYGLIFFLGSFTVASLSDIKYMKAQAEFGEVWILGFIFFLILDLWKINEIDQIQFVAKWMLIVGFIILSNMHTGFLFKLAWGDIFACIAVMAILTPALIIVFIIALEIFKFIFKPFLKLFGSNDAYPFMPIVMAGTITVVVLGTYIVQYL